MAQYSVNEATKKKLMGWLPYGIGAVLVVQFIALGFWQIDRGLQKREQQQAFEPWREACRLLQKRLASEG